MNKFLKKVQRLEKKHLGAIIFVQTLLIAILALNMFVLNPSNTKVLSETTDKSAQITEAAALCLNLDQDARAGCAKTVGEKIAAEFNTPEQRLKECSKFRPYSYVYDCEEGLSEGQ